MHILDLLYAIKILQYTRYTGESDESQQPRHGISNAQICKSCLHMDALRICMSTSKIGVDALVGFGLK